MGSVLASKHTKSPQTTGKRGRKRKNEPTPVLSKRNRDEEKENNYSISTRWRKSVSTTPPASAATPEIPRKSPRKLRNSPRNGTIHNVGGGPEKRCETTRKSRRKPEIARRWSCVLKMKNAVKGHTPAELLDKWIEKAPRVPHGIYLARNVKRAMAKRGGWQSARPDFCEDKIIDYELLNKLRIRACARSGERPVFGVEFEKINDWAHTIEAENIDCINCTAHITWDVVIVDDLNRVRIFRCGFAVVPLFKQVEENLNKVALSKLAALKLRAFSCPEAVLRSARDAYIVVEAKRFVRKDIHNIISEGKRRRVAVTNPPPMPSEISRNVDPTNYVTMRLYGARRLFGFDQKRGAYQNFVEGVTHIVLVEQHFNDINFKNVNWMTKLDNLYALEQQNAIHGNSYLPRLVISPIDDRLPENEVFPKFGDFPRGTRGDHDMQIMYSLHAMLSETNSVMYNRYLQEFRNMSDTIQYRDPEHFRAHMAARFPCFRMEIAPKSNGSNFVTVNVSADADFFKPNTVTNLFSPFIFRRRVAAAATATPSSLAVRRFHRVERAEDAARRLDYEWDEANKSHLPDMPVSYLPCCTLQWVTRSRIAEKTKIEEPEEVIEVKPSKEVLKRAKRGRKAGKAEAAVKVKIEEPDEVMETAPEPQVMVRVPKENARFISEILIRTDPTEATKRKEREEAQAAIGRQGQRVKNYQLDEADPKIEAYRERQRDAYNKLLGVINNNRKKKKILVPHGASDHDLIGTEAFLEVRCKTKKEKEEVEKKEKKKEGMNGGTELDIEGNTIPVAGCVEFESTKLELYNVFYREFLANEGHRFGSHGIPRKASLISGFLETCHMPLFEHELDHIFLKHLDLLHLTSAIDSSSFTGIYLRFVELSHQFGAK